jgi:predicted porin
LYGWVDQSHNTVVTTTKGDTKKTTNTWGASQGGTSALGVKGDEDLGDGMKATYLLEIAINAEDKATPDNFNRQSFVGLDGAFGGIKIGRQYSPSFNALAAVDPSGVSGFNGYMALNGFQTSRGFYYTSPGFSGINVIVGSHEGGDAESSKGNIATFGATYTGGALYASITQETTTKGTTTVGLNSLTVGSTTAGENKLQTFAATYDMGVAKIGVLNETVDSSSDSSQAKATHFSVAVPIGSLTLGAIFGSGSYTATGTTTSVDMSSTGLTADYALSKKTKVYFRYGETNDKQTTAANLAKSTTTAVGLQMNF